MKADHQTSISVIIQCFQSLLDCCLLVLDVLHEDEDYQRYGRTDKCVDRKDGEVEARS